VPAPTPNLYSNIYIDVLCFLTWTTTKSPGTGWTPATRGSTCPSAGPATRVTSTSPGATRASSHSQFTTTARPARNFPKYRPEFLAKVAELEKNQLQFDPVLHCRSPGLPRIGPPDKIVQLPGQIVFLYDDVSGNFFRIIPTNGHPHRTDVDPSTFGDSIGHWDGDTLVVEANQFNDDSWLTDNGAFHSTELTVTERLRRVGDTLQYQAVATDPRSARAVRHNCRVRGPVVTPAAQCFKLHPVCAGIQ